MSGGGLVAEGAPTLDACRRVGVCRGLGICWRVGEGIADLVCWCNPPACLNCFLRLVEEWEVLGLREGDVVGVELWMLMGQLLASSTATWFAGWSEKLG